MTVLSRIRIVVVLLLVVGGGGWWWLGGTGVGTSAGLTLYGNVDIREVELVFRQGGRLLAVKVNEGDKVKAGDVLAEIDPQPFLDGVAAAAAEVAMAQADLARLLKGSRIQEVRRAEAQLAQAEAALSRGESELARQEQLASGGATSERSLQAARSGRDEAVAAVEVARQTLSLAREGVRQEDIKVGRARVAGAQARKSQADTALADTRLLAPNAGVILARVREPGSMVSNRDPVLTLSLQSPTYVRAYVAESSLGRVAPGTVVTVVSDSSPTRYRGQVGFVSPRAEFTPKSVETADLRTDLVYRLRIVVDNSDGKLLQGMPVTVTIQP